ncbi:MAG: CoA transferase, partial [Acidimicrobiales bacterium]
VNTFLTSDEQWLTVTSATPRSVANVAALLRLPVEEFSTPQQQAARGHELDDGLRAWIATKTLDECVTQMAELEVVASPIFSMADIAASKTYEEREAIVTVEDVDLGPIKMQNVVPKLANHGGRVWRAGPQLGEDNDLVYREHLGLSAERFAALKAAGTI